MKTNVQVVYSINFIVVLTIIGMGMVFEDDGLMGVS